MDNDDFGKQRWFLYDQYKAVEHELLELFRYIEFNKSFKKTNSAKIRNQILSACALLESAKPLVDYIIEKKNTGEEEIESHEKMSMSVKIYEKLSDNLNVDLAIIRVHYRNKFYYPWAKEVSGKGYKFTWWDDYNAIKHNKDVTTPFWSAIQSTFALFVLLVYITGSIENFWYNTDVIKFGFKNGSTERPYQYGNGGDLRSIIAGIS